MAENRFYGHTSGQPVQLSRGASAAIRSELTAIATGFSRVEDELGAASSSADFKLIYQGARATDPTQRYNGTQLQDGDMYFNSSAKVMKSFASGAWHSPPTVQSVITKDGGTFTGNIGGTGATFTGIVNAGGFSGDGSQLAGLTRSQVTTALKYTPLNKAGDSMTGALNGTTATFTGPVTAQDVTISSDESFKDEWAPIRQADLKQFASISLAGTYRDKRTGQRMVGVGAQSLQKIMPEAIRKDADDKLTVAYGQAALVLVHKLTQKVLSLEARIEAMEKK